MKMLKTKLVFILFCYFPSIICLVHSQELHDMERGVPEMVGGRIPEFGEYPFMVSIRYKSSWKQVCGGSIISPVFVLTACHCVCHVRPSGGISPKPSSLFQVVAGWQILVKENPQDSSFSQFRDILNINAHPECRKLKGIVGWENDLAVLTMSVRFNFNRHIKAFKIYSHNVESMRDGLEEIMESNEECAILGWGSSFLSSKYKSDVLKAVQIKFIEPFSCQRKLCANHKSFCNFTHFHRKLVCLEPTSNDSVCTGDSGGPLLCKGLVWGILNWSPSCGKPQIPIMFSKLEEHLQYYMKFAFAPSSSRITTNINSKLTIGFAIILSYKIQF